MTGGRKPTINEVTSGELEQRVAHHVQDFAVIVGSQLAVVIMVRALSLPVLVASMMTIAFVAIFTFRWVLAVRGLGSDAERYERDPGPEGFWSKRHPAWEQEPIAWTCGLIAATLVILAAIL